MTYLHLIPQLINVKKLQNQPLVYENIEWKVGKNSVTYMYILFVH
jgi:hypothetical protein